MNGARVPNINPPVHEMRFKDRVLRLKEKKSIYQKKIFFHSKLF